MAERHHTMLAAIRRAAGRTQQQVADELGVGKTTYSAWETGRSELGADRIVALSHALNCTPNDILGFGADRSRFAIISAEEEELVSLFRLLPPNIRDDVTDIMRTTARGSRWRG